METLLTTKQVEEILDETQYKILSFKRESASGDENDVIVKTKDIAHDKDLTLTMNTSLTQLAKSKAVKMNKNSEMIELRGSVSVTQ